MKKLLLALLLCLCLTGSVFAADISDFPDAEVHWARPALEAAVSADILRGLDDGTLSPNASVTGTQALTMLSRILDLPVDEPVPGEPWYAPVQRAAKEAGILPDWPGWDAAAPLTRGRAFSLLAAAFQLHTTDTSYLDAFPDAAGLTGEAAWAAAGMVQVGAAGGSDGALRPNAPVTRAEFATLLHRLTGLGQDGALLALEDGPSVRWSRKELDGGVALLPSVESVSLQNVTAGGPVVLRAGTLEDCTLRNVEAPRLVLAADGDFALNSGAFDSVQIGGGSGEVALSNGVTAEAEVFGDGRTVRLEDMDLARLAVAGDHNTVILDAKKNAGQSLELLVAGSGNTVVINGAAGGLTVGEIALTGGGNSVTFNENTAALQLRIPEGAADNKVTVHGTLGEAVVVGRGTVLGGDGSAARIDTAALGASITLPAQTLHRDTGFTGATVSLNAPTVAPGGAISVTATIQGLEGDKVVRAQWYLDGQPLKDFGNPASAIYNGKTSRMGAVVEFTRNMPLSHKAAYVLEYENTITGKLETLRAEAAVQIQNYPDTHYTARDPELAKQVSSTYVGNYTVAYNIDYSRDVKESFVNTRGYSSKTDYLLWINRHTQKVMLFRGSQWNWQLIGTYRCGTGAPGTPTPVGVTYVTYKEAAWHSGNYSAYYIVRFYPGTGYAFHTRLYYPGSHTNLKYPDIGYPMSAGCIRMYDEDLSWIHKNVPVNTTVVIY